MKTCQESRRDNLKALADEYGSNAALAKVIGKADAQIYQWLSASPDAKTGRPRAIHDDTAREIEQKCGKEIGWMDNDHSDPGLEAFKKLPKEVRAWLMRQGGATDEQIQEVSQK